MKNILIVGSSGMVGGIVLRQCLQANEVEKVTAIVRRPLGMKHPKLVEVIHKDYMDYSAIEAHFKNQNVAQFCIGAYTGQVPDDEFKKITFDFVQVFADLFKTQNPDGTFCLLSGQGADQSEKSRVAFARYKGMAENYLMAKEFGQFYSFRPGYIYPVEKREEPNLMYRVSRSLYPVLKRIFPSAAITSETLGKAMCKAGLHGTFQTILENEDIKKV